MPELTRVNVVVSGRVQGVFFRANTVDKARRLGLTGWVRNRRDGWVEAEFQGPSESVDQAVEFCRNSPGSAAVTDVKVETREVAPDESAFVVD
jgi:acylphosphatase